MTKTISRFDRMDMLREAAESSWLSSFMSNFQPRPAKDLLPYAREGIFLYLRERYAPILWEQGVGRADSDVMLREIADEAVIVKPRHRAGACCIVGRWAISELGDTHDGEYEQVAPPWTRS